MTDDAVVLSTIAAPFQSFLGAVQETLTSPAPFGRGEWSSRSRPGPEAWSGSGDTVHYHFGGQAEKLPVLGEEPVCTELCRASRPVLVLFR